MKEIRKVFCLKYLNMFSVPLQFLAVCVGYFFIEAMSRHSLFEAADFMMGRPLVFLYNAALIFTTTLVVYLFRRRVFVRTILTIFTFLFRDCGDFVYSGSLGTDSSVF